MERYHILKLGLAITFYAAYCIRPMLVYSLEADNELDNNPSVLNPDHEYFQYFQGVEGKPGIDFPVYSYIPRTAFSCRGIESGYYADLDTDCQVFHICEEGRKVSFLCPNGTIFQQSELICEWWNKVNCSNSPNLYEESAERLQNDIARSKASRRVLNGADSNHGAIMRTEERTSVRASQNGRDYPIRQQKQRQQRIKNHRIPDNNDIEQQIERAESNNRHLANAQNSLQTSQRSNFGNQQQRNPNHNYNAVGQSDVDNQPTISKQIKKDVDTNTGNYVNNNYEQSATRHSKKVEQGARNSFEFGSKAAQDKSTTLKEYHVQFGSTNADVATEDYSSAQASFQSTQQQYRGTSGFNQNQYTYSYSTESPTSYGTYEENINSERFGTKTTSRVPQTNYNNVAAFSTRVASTTAVPLSSTKDSLRTSTVTSAQKTKTTTPGYGSGIKGRFASSFDGQQPQKSTTPETTKSSQTSGKLNQNSIQSSQSNYRGSTKFNVNSNYLNGQGSAKHSTPITTYSPPTKYSAFKATEKSNYKFELTQPQISRSDVQNRIQNNGQSVPNTVASGQISANLVQQPNHKPTENQNPVGAETVAHNTKNNHQESEETQIPQESSSFVKNSFNSITDDSSKTSPSPYPNHRSTYSDIKEQLSFLEAPKISAISSITPHLVTTQPINNGKPFVGSRVGNTIFPNQQTTQSKYTYLPTTTASSKPTVIFGVLRHRSTTEPPPFGPPLVNGGGITDLLNTGNTDKTLPPVETTNPVTNPVPTNIFNVGRTDTTLQANIVPDILNTTVPPLKIYVPEQGSLNVGQTNDVSNDYQGQEPVNEPPFIKKTVPLLYNSTERTIDQATVYGSYASSTQRSLASSRNTPYSPTVPTVTQSSSVNGYSVSSTSRTPQVFNQAVPIKFDRGQDKISIHLSKNVGSQTRNDGLLDYGGSLQSPLQKVGAVLHVADDKQGSSSTLAPGVRSNGFYVTRGFGEGTQAFSAAPKSKTEKPRPFSKSLQLGDRLSTGNSQDHDQTTPTPNFPTYQLSSARPFGVSETTSPTPTIITQTSTSPNVYDNVDNMIGVLQEIANYNSEKKTSEEARPGLVIPPSVGPQTLHSLAQYFANELQNNGTNNAALQPDTKEKLTSLLTAMTVHGYNNLFNVGATATPTAPTSTVEGETTTIPTSARFGSEESNKASGESSTTKDNSSSDDGDLLTTTSLPELRQLARNFSLALSSYLNDPDNFRKNLESLRPTEPPPLDGSDNIESSTSEDELLNFSDADIKPSTPANPSPTWGYILAAEANKGPQEDVKNSLNPDLNTADSQSFVPRFNNVQVDERQGKGFTDLPPNHWTSSPKATRLWQKALSVNPAIVNDQFETTPSSIVLTEEETTEPELYNPDVLPELTEPHSEITYELRELPPLALNSTQIHGILINFMNHTKSDGQNRLNRILKKLNTSEEEFLDRMKEIESNPLTKRLILLLISECGANITQDIGLSASNYQRIIPSEINEPSSQSAGSSAAASSNIETRNIENHALGQLVNPHLSEEDQDTRALQLLNSLYTIASRFGRKR